MEKPTFDSANPDLLLLRRAILQRLRKEPGWRHVFEFGQMGIDIGKALEPWLSFVRRHGDGDQLAQHTLEVFWQLAIEGVLAPGFGSSNANLPWFHVTAYGRHVIEAELEYRPHDPTGYLQRLQQRIVSPDPTVVAYVEESLRTFLSGNLVASTVMLGVAAERVFDLLAESLRKRLRDVGEKEKLTKLLGQNAMKPKVDWVAQKLRTMQEMPRNKRPRHFPDNATLMFSAIGDFIRTQRNEFGHPREKPPLVRRGDALASLEVFPRYYETAETLRRSLRGRTH
jgi:hypothetical protein